MIVVRGRRMWKSLLILINFEALTWYKLDVATVLFGNQAPLPPCEILLSISQHFSFSLSISDNTIFHRLVHPRGYY
jgi:hypothetical protein